MAFDSPDLPYASFKAAADLSAAQYKFVKLDGNGDVVVCSAATDRPVGVLQNAPTSGQMATVQYAGITKVQADAALNEGDLVGTSADGQADAKTPGGDTTEYVVGQMLTAPGAAGRIGTALINCANPHRAA